MNTISLLNYMDELRYERKLNQENYLHGIISQRQYYRYLYGESEPPFEVVLELSKKLNLSIDRLINKYQEDNEKEKRIVRKYFNLVINRKFSESAKLSDIIKKFKNLDEGSLVILKLGNILCDFYCNIISKIELIERLKTVIQLEKMLKHEFLMDTELYVLGILMEYSEKDREDILERILVLNKDGKLLTFGNHMYSIQVYFYMIKNLGRLKRLDELISVSKNAIEFIKERQSIYLLGDIYYYCALAYFKKNNILEFENQLYLTIEIIRLLPVQRVKYFTEMIQRDTGYSIDEFYISELQRRL